MASFGGLATGGLVAAGAVAFGLVAANLYDRTAALAWERAPYPPGHLVAANGARLYVRVKGHGSPAVVVETALGSPSAEWWHIQDELAATTTVLTYDRAGYGWSRPGPFPRSASQVVLELHAMLGQSGVPAPYIIVGHSQGGLYAQLFGRLHPDLVAGAVFLDPVSSDNQRFKAELRPEAFRLGGFDRMPALSSLRSLGRLGMVRPSRTFIESRLLAHQARLPAATREVIWQHYALAKAQKAVLDECRQNETAANSSDVRSAGDFPRVPVRVMYHSPRRMMRELSMLAALPREDAEEVENIWQQLVRAYLKLSPLSEWIVAPESGHFIHLDQPDLVVAEIRSLVESVRHAAGGGGAAPA